jgi:tetratricopeptide (TPR) repeat protein
MILWQQKQYNTAINVCKKAINKDNRHPFPKNILGSIYVDLNQLNKAEQSFKEAIKLSAEFSPAYTNLGFVYLQKGDVAQATKYFTRANILSPNTASPHYGLALIHERRGNLNGPIAELEKSLAIKSGNPAALVKLGELQLKPGQYDNTPATAKKLEPYNPDQALEIKADAYLHLGKTNEAGQSLESISQKTANGYYLYGLSYAIEEDYNAAARQMDKALGIDKRHFGAITSRSVFTDPHQSPTRFKAIVL